MSNSWEQARVVREVLWENRVGHGGRRAHALTRPRAVVSLSADGCASRRDDLEPSVSRAVGYLRSSIVVRLTCRRPPLVLSFLSRLFFFLVTRHSTVTGVRWWRVSCRGRLRAAIATVP